MAWAYVFEAKKLQNFIFSTGKLRDAVGASAMLNSLAHEAKGDAGEDLLRNVLDRFGDSLKDRKIQRRASGAILIGFPTAARETVSRFRACWRLCLAERAPGLTFIDAIVEGTDDTNALRKARELLRTAAVSSERGFPLATPYTRQATQTGRAAVHQKSRTKKDGTCVIVKGEFVDASTITKRQFLKQKDDTVARLFAPPTAKNLRWPSEMDPESARSDAPLFPFFGDDRYVGIAHADGNRVGQVFMKLYNNLDGRSSQGVVRKVSLALSRATRQAAQYASQEILVPKAVNGVVPARPILLGGDDLTIILRADIAIDFLETYQRAFSTETHAAFRELTEQEPALCDHLHDHLTAKAGVVFVKSRQPFARAYELCEALATSAGGDEARLAFFRCADAEIPVDVDAVVRKSRGGGVSLWRPMWRIGDELDGLRALRDALAHEAVGRGALRRVPEALLSDHKTGVQLYVRALDVLKGRNIGTYNALVDGMKRCGVENPERTPLCSDNYSPLLDALVWARLIRGAQQAEADAV